MRLPRPLAPAVFLAVLVLLIAVITIPVRLAAQGPHNSSTPTSYRVFNLGTLPGGTLSEGYTINDLGWVMGQSLTSVNGQMMATLWLGGLKIPLGTLGGLNSSVLWPNKNVSGQIVGVAETAKVDPNGELWSCSGLFAPAPPTLHQCLGFVWQFGHMSPLPTLGGNNGFAAAENDLGKVVGWSETPVHDPTCSSARGTEVLQFRATWWGVNGKAHALPMFQSDPDSAATAINDHNQIVGISGLCDVASGEYSAQHAVMWDDDQVIDMGNLGAQAWNTPMDINLSGEVVGFAEQPGVAPGTNGSVPLIPLAFYWHKGMPAMQQLNPLPNNPNAVGYGINNAGLMVGGSIEPNGSIVAVIWQNGVPADMNGLVSGSTPLFLLLAQAVNDEGAITGLAFDTNAGELVAFLAVPTTSAGDDASAANRTVQRGGIQNLVAPANALKLLKEHVPFLRQLQVAKPK